MTQMKNEPEIFCFGQNATTHSENTHKLCTCLRQQGLSEAHLRYLADFLIHLEKSASKERYDISFENVKVLRSLHSSSDYMPT